MSALLRKELRELAPFAGPATLVLGLGWFSLASLGDYLGRHSEGFALMALCALAAGTVLGMAPFEVERWAETRAYLLHRATTARDVALQRIGAAALWTALLVAVSMLAGPLAHLGPAFAVEGFPGRIVGGLVLAAGMALPGLGMGALAATLALGRLARCVAAVLGALALALWGGRLTTAAVLDSEVAWLPYLAFVLLAGGGLVALAIARFERSARDVDDVAPASRLLGAGLALAIALPPALAVVGWTQHFARELALRDNESWTVTLDGTLRRRPTEFWDVLRSLRAPTFVAVREEGERTVFDCVYGDGGDARPLGSTGPVWDASGWALGRRRAGLGLTGHAWFNVWFDADLGRLVVWSLDLDTAELTTLGPGAGLERFVEMPQVVHLDMHRLSSGLPGLLVIEPGSRTVGYLSQLDAGRTLRPLELPTGERPVDLVRGLSIRYVRDGQPREVESDWLVLGERDAYVLDDGRLLPVEEFDVRRPEARPPIAVRISDRDGLGYTATLIDEHSGEVLGRSEHGPRTAGERAAATFTAGLTLLRTPLGSLSSMAVGPRTAEVPSVSLWIDPLTLGGRRPWLVVLHQAFALALAWLARRRLGGRAWGWPLAIVALGVAAWLVCRVLEPRRMAPRVREEPRGVPAWAPIADRAGV